MAHCYAGTMGDLPAADLGITYGCVATALLHPAEEIGTDIHGNLIFFGFVAVAAGQATAGGTALVEFEARHEFENIERRPADAMRSLLAWCMVWQHGFDRLKIGLEFTLFVQQPEKFEDVVGVFCHHAGCAIVHGEQFGSFFFQGQGAAGAGTDDRNAAFDIWCQPCDIVFVVALCMAERAIREQRQATTSLFGDDHLETVVFEHFNRCLADTRFVVVGRTAVEVDHLAFLSVAGGAAAKPAAEREAAEPGQRCVARNADDLLGKAAYQPIIGEEVGNCCLRAARQFTKQILVAEQPAAQRQAALLNNTGLGTGVELHDLDPGRADFVADPAPRTIINRFVGAGLARFTKALRLWPDILRPGEEIGDGPYRAGSGADIALDTVIERLLE